MELPNAWLENVRDRTRGIRNEERDPYYQILAAARTADPQALRAAGRETAAAAERAFRADPGNKRRKFSLFAELARQPGPLRGRPVTLHGYIQRLESFEAGENDEGLTTLHQAYLFTGDSLQSPYVVVCSELTPGIPIPSKGQPTNDIFVSGYFFKLWSYDAERGTWAAPLILAHTLEWHPRPIPLTSRASFKGSLAAGLALTLLLIAYWLRRQRLEVSRLREARLDSPTQLSNNDLAQLERMNDVP
ncbi:MAG: hypothetical protein ACKV0T_30015 [Planctomycetales bacterium]